MLGSAAMCSLSFWQSMNSFQWPGISVINKANILYSMKVSFKCFEMSWNTYFLYYLCQIWSHSRHLVDSSIALFSQSLTLSNICAFILSKLLITLICYHRLQEALSTETAHEYTQSKQNDMHHAEYVARYCRPLDSRWHQGLILVPMSSSI